MKIANLLFCTWLILGVFLWACVEGGRPISTVKESARVIAFESQPAPLMVLTPPANPWASDRYWAVVGSTYGTQRIEIPESAYRSLRQGQLVSVLVVKYADGGVRYSWDN